MHGDVRDDQGGSARWRCHRVQGVPRGALCLASALRRSRHRVAPSQEWSAARTAEAADVDVTIDNLNPGSTYNFRLSVGDEKGPELVVDTQGASLVSCYSDPPRQTRRPPRSAQLHAETEVQMRHILRTRPPVAPRRGARAPPRRDLSGESQDSGWVHPLLRSRRRIFGRASLVGAGTGRSRGPREGGGRAASRPLGDRPTSGSRPASGARRCARPAPGASG